MYACNCGKVFPDPTSRVIHAHDCKLMKSEREVVDLTQKLDKVQGENAHLDQCNTEFIVIHNAQAAEIRALKAEVEFLSKNRAENMSLRLDLTHWQKEYAAAQAKRESADLQNGVMRKALEDIAKREGPGLDGSSENATGRKARLALEGKYETSCPKCAYSYWLGSVCTHCGFVENRVGESMADRNHASAHARGVCNEATCGECAAYRAQEESEKRLDACTCPHHEKAPHLTSCRCCSGKVNDS